MLECLVFGERAAQSALGSGAIQGDDVQWDTVPLSEAIPATQHTIRNTQHATRTIPPNLPTRLDVDLGVERDGTRLAALVADLPDPFAPDCPADGVLAALAARAALLRAESRGGHYRTDYPDTDPAWRGRIGWQRTQVAQFEAIND
jgi:L-aspartate oxidase